MPQKPIEFWLLVGALTLYTVLRSPLRWVQRLGNALIALALALALSGIAGEVMTWQLLSAAAIQLFGIQILDTLSVIAADREYWTREGRAMVTAWLRQRLGLPPAQGEDRDEDP